MNPWLIVTCLIALASAFIVGVLVGVTADDRGMGKEGRGK